MSETSIGKSVKRREDIRFITGQGRYTDDISQPGQTVAVFLRSPHARARIVSVDAARGACDAMIAGKLNVTVECNPLLGPQFFELALKVINGEPVPRRVPSKESIFFPDNALEILPSRKY